MASKKKKSLSRPSIVVRLFCLISRLIGWLIRMIARGSRKNPLLALGLALFTITFGFVSYNAFFRQPAIHRNSFFSIRGHPAAQDISPSRTGFSSMRHNAPAGNGGRQGAPVPGYDMDLKEIQKKLADLGLYKGEIDGLSGPRTIQAIERWEQLQKGLMPRSGISGEMTDSIGAVIRTHNSAADAASARRAGQKTVSVPAKALVARIQRALRSLGNGNIIVNEVVDQPTEKAIREFQQRFALPVTGKIDSNLTDKMRDIGLFG